jgi:hypothetical protein
MNAGKVTLETVVREVQRAYRAVRISRGGMSISIVAGNKEWLFRYDGATDQWTRI